MKSKRIFRCCLVSSLILILLGCGEEVIGPNEEPISNLVATLPPQSATITVVTEIKLVFDNPPFGDSVSVNGTSAILEGHVASWRTKAHYDGSLKVVWVNRNGTFGTERLTFRLTEIDNDPPLLADWSLRDYASVGNQAVNVDPERINREGITFRCTEPIKQAWAWIFQEGPDALYCDVTLSNEVVKFTPTSGYELVSGRKYTIHGVVTDFGDNYTTIKETFETKH